MDEPRERKRHEERPEQGGVKLEYKRQRRNEFGIRPERDERPHVGDEHARAPEGAKAVAESDPHAGHDLGEDQDEDDDGSLESRVVGLIDTFRRGGDFGELNPMMFQPVHEEQDDGEATAYFVLKLAANTSAEFEQTRKVSLIR